MIRHLLLTGTSLLLSACATQTVRKASSTPPALVEAQLEQEPIQALEMSPQPGQLKRIKEPRLSPAAESPERAIEKGAKAARIEPSLSGYVNAVQVYPYTEGALYRLYGAPGQVSDIALEAGESLISVSAGDTVRWVVGDTQSGTGNSARAHVLVKPIAADLQTNLMIATDRRTYHLELKSTPSAYMAALSWRYPENELSRSGRSSVAGAQSLIAIAGVDAGALNFSYRIEGDRPTWRPVRAFDDGRKVFIEMPSDLATTDAPPLFIRGSSGKAELVNYRLSGRYYIVDRLFEAAELRLGEKRQQVVRVVKSRRGR